MFKPVVVAAFCWAVGGAIVLNDAWLRGAQVLLVISLFALFGDLLFPLDRRGVWRKTAWLAIAVLSISTTWNGVYDWHMRSRISEDALHRLGEAALWAEGTIVSRINVDGDRASFAMRLHRLAAQEEALLFPRSGLVRETVQVAVRLESVEEQSWMAARQRGETLVIQGQLERPGEARNFDAFDYRRYLRWQGIHWVLNVRGLSEASAIESSRFSVQRLLAIADRWRTRWTLQIDRLFPSEQRGWMKSMTVGIRDDLEPDLFEQFSMVGISHVLAISGLHVGVFLAVVLAVLTLIGCNKNVRLNIGIAMMPLYIVFTGAAPSVLRAGIMAMIGLYALKKDRLKDGLNIVCATGILLLIWNPYYLLHTGFQLSFTVTIGLIVFMPLWKRHFPIRPAWLSNAVAVTAVAEIVSFPLTAYYFHHFSLLSWLANLLLIPLVSLIVIPGTMAAVAIGWIHFETGSGLARIVTVVNQFVIDAVYALNRIDPLYFHWPEPSPWWLAVYFCSIAMLAFAIEWRRRVRNFPHAVLTVAGERLRFLLHMHRHVLPTWLIVASLALLTGTIVYGYAPNSWQRTGEVHFIDVGQGDAALIRTPHNVTLLVDGGGSLRFIRPGEEWRVRRDPFEVGRDVIVPLLKMRGVQRIDYLVMTHHDYDHIGGLMAVLDRVPVGRILFNGTLRESEYVTDLFEQALRKGIPLHAVADGDIFQLDAYTKLQVLYPTAGKRKKTERVYWADRQNESSIVFLLDMYDHTFLLTGDVYAAGEQEIIAGRVARFKADVMKAAHHGSRTSSSEPWLDYWQPRITVISVGRNNRYGHPHDEVLERLKRYGSEVFRTDKHGEVQFRVQSGKLELRTKLDASD